MTQRYRNRGWHSYDLSSPTMTPTSMQVVGVLDVASLDSFRYRIAATEDIRLDIMGSMDGTSTYTDTLYTVGALSSTIDALTSTLYVSHIRIRAGLATSATSSVASLKIHGRS